MALAVRPIAVFGGVTLFGVVAIYLVVGLANGGHGTYLPAKLLFPYTMLLALPEGPIPIFAQVVAALQFPAYGIAAASNTSAGRGLRASAAIAAVHAVAVAAALALVPSELYP